MPFIPSQQQNDGFQKGWNMIMNLYGRKQINERTEAQQKQFDEQQGLREKKYKFETDAYKAEQVLSKKDREYDEKFRAEIGGLKPDSPTYGRDVQNTIIKYYPAKSGPIVSAQMKAETPEQKRAAQQKITQQNQQNAAKIKEEGETIPIYLPDGRSLKIQRKNLGAVKEKYPGATIIKPAAGPKYDKASLTKRALGGDLESAAILEEMQDASLAVAEAQGLAAANAKLSIIDIEGTAEAIITGREEFSSVRNTFGVAVQEAIRKAVLKKDPTFNFLKPRVKLKAIQSTMTDQYKRRGAMGSFVNNLNKQMTKVETRMEDIQNRVGLRALDLPWRELRTRFVGSGHENVLTGYMKEISAEISKLSQGATASVAQLSDTQQREWDKIHDPNLSLKELLIVLEGTREMANMRLESVDEEISSTMDQLDNLRMEKGLPPKKKSRFKIIKVD